MSFRSRLLLPKKLPFADASARRAFFAFGGSGGGSSAATFRRIAFVGDSITYGYNSTDPATQSFVALVTAAAQSRDASVVTYNLGIPGAKAADAATSFPTWLETHTPDLTIIGLGANDVLQATSIPNFIASLNTVFAAAKAVGDVGVFIFPALSGFNQTPYVQALRALAVSYGAVFVCDIFARWGNYAAGLSSGFQSGDGIHPSNAGHADIAAAMEPLLFAATKDGAVTAYGVTAHPVAWWKADSLAASDGDTVSAWGDSSHHGLLLTPSSGGAPGYRVSAFAEGAVYFAGGRSLVNAAFAALGGLAAATVFIVYRKFTTGALQLLFAPANGAAELLAYNDGKTYTYASAGNSGQFALDDTSKHIHEVIFDGSQSGNAARLVILEDGVAQSLAFTGTIPATTATDAGLGVGSLPDGTFPASADIPEILAYASALGSSDRATIRAALQARYHL